MQCNPVERKETIPFEMRDPRDCQHVIHRHARKFEDCSILSLLVLKLVLEFLNMLPSVGTQPRRIQQAPFVLYI